MIPYIPTQSESDGYVKGISKPALAQYWSAAFSFAKCHLEESVPYDNFAPQLFDAEQFTRYVRMFTRGYDVYTPTRNIVYHDYGPGPKDVDPKGWTQNAKERNAALSRMHTLLQVGEGLSKTSDRANLGIYGLGKRRTLKQWENFLHIDIIAGKGNGKDLNCANLKWVPYDLTISPTKNMYDNADDLDPQPEYPFRNSTHKVKVDRRKSPLKDILKEQVKAMSEEPISEAVPVADVDYVETSEISYEVIAILWIVGIIIWSMSLFLSRSTRSLRGKGRKRDSYKDI